MKRYGIKEVFGTLQGEGAQAGMPAVFLRFSGCNLGYEVCPWCDTDWVKPSAILELSELADLVDRTFAESILCRDAKLVVITGGEPSLQFDEKLSRELRDRGFRIAMETNGSRPVDRGLVDWLTVSPKQTEFIQRTGDEMKLVFTGAKAPGISPTVDSVRALAEDTSFDHYFLQPLDLGEGVGSNFDEAVSAVMNLGSPWRLGIQMHKVLQIR